MADIIRYHMETENTAMHQIDYRVAEAISLGLGCNPGQCYCCATYPGGETFSEGDKVGSLVGVCGSYTGKVENESLASRCPKQLI